MSDIYRGAARVKSWIGLSDVYTNYVFAYTKHHRSEAFLSSKNFAQAKRKALDSLQTVFDRPYWKRLWVIQEIALAKELVILCGSRIISWDQFIDAFDQDLSPYHTIGALSGLRRAFFRAKHPKSAFDSLSTQGKSVFPQDAQIIPESSLIAQMSRFGSQICEDDRDRIFGLLSFVDDGDQIAVDYTKPLVDVLADVVLVTYDCTARIRNEMATSRPSHQSRLQADCPADTNQEHTLSSFIRDFRSHMRSTTLLMKPRNLLYSLPDVNTHSSVRIRLDRLIWERSRVFSRSLSRLSDNNDETVRETWYASVLLWSTDMLVDWDSHRTVPQVVADTSSDPLAEGCWRSFGNNPSNLPSMTDRISPYQALLEIGELQLCSQAQQSQPDQFARSGFKFFVHMSLFAILFLICCSDYPEDTIHLNDNVDFDIIQGCLRDRRKKYPWPNLCTCDVSEQANLEAFGSYEIIRNSLGKWAK